MIAKHLKTSLPVAVVTVTVLMLTAASGATAAAPVKLILKSHFGEAGTGPGAFTNNPESVAGAPQGDVYVDDQGNNRVQEFTSKGVFVRMFGWEVNETKDKTPGATQAAKNICAAATGDVCKAGVQGPAAGQFAQLANVTVDPTSKNVYTAEFVFGSVGVGERLQEFTGEGRFVLEIGEEVNATTKGNLCTQEEVEKSGVKCTGPAEKVTGVPPSGEPGTFNFAQFRGDLLAAGGPEDLLYVGDEHRVQEFSAATGEYKREISLPNSDVTALAVDGLGDVYLVDGASNVVREFDTSGVEVHQFARNPRNPGAEIKIGGIAIDPAGLLAVTELELNNGSNATFGSLYNAPTGHLVTEFTLPGQSSGIGFNGNGELYAVASAPEVLGYEPVNVAELVASPAVCVPGAEHESDATFDCALKGTVNPEGVSETEAWLQWGRTPALGSPTPMQPVATGVSPVPVSASIEGVLPNETIYYRVAAQDANVHPPELLTSETTSVSTPIVAPRIVGEASESFVQSSSAVMSGAVNPEHANTRYEFQYGPCQDDNPEKCAESPYPLETTPAESATYGKIGATFEVVELQPATVYHYLLVAASENNGKTEKQETIGPENQFTTSPAPKVHAQTAAASMVATTSAIVSGTVEPGGRAASYTFELGVYAGAQTEYGIVVSGSVPASAVPVVESLVLTGLQPGTTYAYRITIASGYGKEQGEPRTFTTEGLPSVLISPTPLAMLGVPKNVHFPKPVSVPKHRKTKHKKSKGKKSKGNKTGKRAVNKSNAHKRGGFHKSEK